jgi:hypothetical protein
MKSISSFCLGILLLLLLAGACKKHATTTAPVVPLDFTYSGVAIVDSDLAFRSTVENASSWLWDFGDGTNSALATPVHHYASVGKYNVLLTLNGKLNETITKEIQVFDDPVYTFQMAGSHNWHDTFVNIIVSAGKIDTTGFPDTAISIICINMLQVMLGKDTLAFAGKNATSLYFARDTGFLITESLTYYYATGKMIFKTEKQDVSFPWYRTFQTF